MDGRERPSYGRRDMSASDPEDRPAKAPRIAPYPGLEIRADEVVWSGRFPLQRRTYAVPEHHHHPFQGRAGS